MEARTETRRTLRFPVEQPVEAIWLDNGRVRRIVGRTRDVSAGGVFFYATLQPSEATGIQLMLTLPPRVTLTQRLPVSCKGRVVRVEPQGPTDRVGVAVEVESYEALAPAV